MMQCKIQMGDGGGGGGGGWKVSSGHLKYNLRVFLAFDLSLTPDIVFLRRLAELEPSVPHI